LLLFIASQNKLNLLLQETLRDVFIYAYDHAFSWRHTYVGDKWANRTTACCAQRILSKFGDVSL